MTAIIINRTALKALIDADPDFELQLKGAVIAEIGRRFFEKDAKRVIAAAEPELFAHALNSLQQDHEILVLIQKALTASIVHRDQGYWNRVKLTPEIQKLINEAVENTKRRAIQDASMQVGNAYSAEIQKAVDARLSKANVEELIAKRVDRLADEYINARANELFNARVAKLKEAMS
ncbi:hypothetical protein X766_15670 [Mesorhizobium sp. LSJC255A00]|uniref:hypothetical protein n=1 Tax=Mesorhizobium sp. LSJC255A00 TaxID=1287313 RepID=UPI0003CE482D|nr:hypothetical protein [Mesorhizobium sp. LSJC255A00]ESX17850.1 hypothetical protein X766_15670 [Mesorhizobium sp. LSJC255A00]